jgi:glycosyltransferase involved in cell wall biosynthesis
MTAPLLSLIIATRDRAAFLALALESLAAQDHAPPFEVIVADNGSSDATAKVVEACAGTAPYELRRVYVAEPNRAEARNAGIEAAAGAIVVFVDDDVWLPPRFVAAHANAHRARGRRAVSGPILNVTSYDERPKPSPFNYSNAFLCTCNVSIPRDALLAVSGFDARFKLYGWEDTELGLRLRRSGVRRGFAWDAFLYHIKPPRTETLDELARKATERAQMAALLLEKNPSLRIKLATGAYAANLWRARLVAPASLAPFYRRLTENARLAAPLRALARSQYLDAVYVAALRRALAEPAH